jgi:hypothetical protein
VKKIADALKEMVHETSARSHLNPAGCDTAGREHSGDRSGPDVSDRGGEQPEGDCAVELVVACKLARPDSGRIRVTSTQESFDLWYDTPRQKETLENLCKAIPTAIWNQVQPGHDIAIEQVVGGNGGKGSFQFSCRKYLANSTD